MQNLIKNIQENIQPEENIQLVIQRVTPLIYAMFKRYGYCEDSIEDAYQTSIALLLEALKDYDEGKKLPFVLYLKNKLFYHYMEKIKKISKLNPTPMEEIYESSLTKLTDHNEDFTQNLIWRCEREELQKALELLSERQRWIIEEHYFKGKRLTQISEEAGIFYHALVKLKKRAIDKLKQYFQERNLN